MPHVDNNWRRLGSKLAALFMLTAAPAKATDVAITDEARQRFNTGVALLRDPDGARYEEAYREFKASYQSSPSWKILGNLGLAAMKLERDGEAIAAWERYLSEGGAELEPAERADVERDLATLRASAATLTLTTSASTIQVLDERTPVQGVAVRNRYQSESQTLVLRVRPGHHELVASANGSPAQRVELDVDPGTTLRYAFSFRRPLPPPGQAAATSSKTNDGSDRSIPTSVWVGIAATGVFAAGSAVSGGLALSKRHDYDARNGNDADQARALRDQTKTLNVATDVLLGAALVSAGVTTYLYLDRPQKSGVQGLRLAPYLKATGAAVSLSGVFE